MNAPLPLIAPIGARYESLTVDSKMVNAFAEQGVSEGQFFVYKRPGFDTQTSVAAGTGLGCYYWNGFFYAVVGTTLYKFSSLLVAPTTIGAVNGASKYSFTSCLGATPRLFLSNGTAAYTVSTADVLVNVTAAITGQAGFPASGTWLPTVVNVNGYITLVDIMSNIWTSALNNPATWPGNVGIAQIEADRPVALFKQISYLLCIKQFYTEAFYDAAATPWPYGRVDGAKMNYGCIDDRTICDVGGDVIWVAQTREGNVTVVIVSALKATPISTPPVERILAAADYSGTVYSWVAKVDGHRFYGVTIVNSNITLVYDLTSRLWSQWTDPSGNYLPYSASSIGVTNKVVFQHRSNGSFLHLDIGVFRDNSVVFPVDIYTPNFDGGTRSEKALTKLSIFADQVAGSTVQLRYSDDDYVTWTDAGSVDLSTSDPFWADLGSFKKRAFRFTHSANTVLRVQKVEPIISKGSL